MNVLWFSAGVSSAMVAYLCKDELDEIIYQHIVPVPMRGQLGLFRIQNPGIEVKS